ncbi:MAG: class I SAM-dependent methyltransferase [Pseudomonadota bacterium]
MLIVQGGQRFRVGQAAQPFVLPYLDDFDAYELTPDFGAKNFDGEILLDEGTELLAIEWQTSGQQLKLTHDLSRLKVNLKRFPLAKKELLNRAIGKKTRLILDATGGWGQDALLFACFGYEVLSQERNPLMAIMLLQLMDHVRQVYGSQFSEFTSPNAQFGSSFELSESDIKQFDCVYLDPMFPPKRKQSAASNKYMQFSQAIIGADVDATELLQYCLQAGAKRIVVKRPAHAAPLLAKPSDIFASKLVHYDVYLG